MRQNIKAKETYYDGYRFRSRLEARWAVFFNNIGLEYEYEMEGFDMEECEYQVFYIDWGTEAVNVRGRRF